LRLNVTAPRVVFDDIEAFDRRPTDGAGMTELLVLDVYVRVGWAVVTGMGAEPEL
jgi:hypothetical protein